MSSTSVQVAVRTRPLSQRYNYIFPLYFDTSAQLYRSCVRESDRLRETVDIVCCISCHELVSKHSP